MKSRYSCVDIGKEGCPCLLFESGECLICNRNVKGDCNQCHWQGSCVYGLYMQNHGEIKENNRISREIDIVDKKEYGKELTVYILNTDMGFCQKALSVGAYVFVRNSKDNSWFDTPISILKSETDRHHLHLAVSGTGPKATAIRKCKDTLSVRGVFYSGLENTSFINDMSCDADACIFAKGIAIAPLRNILDCNSRKEGRLRNLKIYLDLDKINMEFLKDYFGDLPIDELFITDMSREFDLILEKEKGFKGKVIALTSPYYVERMKGTFGENIIRPARGRFCCGEGVCGACSFDDEEGKTIHLCKAGT